MIYGINYMKKCFATITFCLIVFSTCLQAELPEPLRTIFNPQLVKTLEEKGEVTSVFKEGNLQGFIPNLKAGQRLSEALNKLKPNFGAIACILHQKVGNDFQTQSSLEAIYNTLLAVSTLKGIYYYSETRKTMRELFSESYRIENPQTRKPLPDLKVTSPFPNWLKIFSFQHDSTFGENTFSLTYEFDSSSFLVQMQNLNTIWYGILPLVDVGQLNYFIIVYPCREYLLFYALVCVKGANPFGILESRVASFYNRIKALDAWFLKELKF